MIGQKRFMRIVRSIFGPPKKGPERSTKDREKLTDLEMKLITESEGHCPDCEVGVLLEGPSGGCSTNFKCSICGSKFNIVPGVWGERISDPSPELEPS